MRQVSRANRFKKDYKLISKRGKKLEKLDAVMFMLAKEGALPPKYKLHKLIGEWEGTWECHIEPDWLLVFEMNSTHIRLLRTGTHSDLF